MKSGIRVSLLPDQPCFTFTSFPLLGSHGSADGGCTTFLTLHRFSLIFMGEQLFYGEKVDRRRQTSAPGGEV